VIQPPAYPADSENAYVLLGRLGRPHGVRGMLHVDLAGNHLRDFIGQNVTLCSAEKIDPLIITPGILRTLTLEKAEPARGDVGRVAFAGVADRDSAARLTNLLIVQPLALMRQKARTQHGSQHVQISNLWYFEMLGLKVIDAEDNAFVGMITAIEDMGRNTLVCVALSADSAERHLEIPLEYPYWGRADLDRQEIQLAEWRHFADG
jgi:ribosomal 30S subunit maturation factor RimM